LIGSRVIDAVIFGERDSVLECGAAAPLWSGAANETGSFAGEDARA
jgi:hypothetical protein